MKHYTVKKGDTLSEIAQKFGVDIGFICAENSIRDPDCIYVGQVLVIPEDYTEPYDTLGQALKVALNDVKKLPSFQTLMKLLKG